VVAEYHGRSHFDTKAWTAYVAAGEPVTSLYFDNGLTYYHYGRRNDSSGLFHSTHSEYRSDDHIHQKSLDNMYLFFAARPLDFRAQTPDPRADLFHFMYRFFAARTFLDRETLW
jgi:hypothetical protein